MIFYGSKNEGVLVGGRENALMNVKLSPSLFSLISSRCSSMRAASLLFDDKAFQLSSFRSLSCNTPSARFSVALILYKAVRTAETTVASLLSSKTYSLPTIPLPAMSPLAVCLHLVGLSGCDSSISLPNLKKSLLRLDCCTKLGEDLSHSGQIPDLKAARLVAACAAVICPEVSAEHDM